MKTFLPLLVFITLSATLCNLSAQFGGETNNLIQNGKFEMADADGRPDFWTISHPNYLQQTETVIEMLSEDNETFYRITKSAATGPGVGWQEIIIPEGTMNLRIAAKMRGQAIVRGGEGWELPGISVTYFFSESEDDSKPGDVSQWLRLPTGDSDWREYESIIPVREGAVRAQIGIVGSGWTGTADITNVEVEAID